jgi:hypothetical protein
MKIEENFKIIQVKRTVIEEEKRHMRSRIFWIAYSLYLSNSYWFIVFLPHPVLLPISTLTLHACNPSTLEAKAGRLWVQGQLDCIERPHLTIKCQKQNQKNSKICFCIFYLCGCSNNFFLFKKRIGLGYSSVVEHLPSKSCVQSLASQTTKQKHV